jgi:hypothetical protein
VERQVYIKTVVSVSKYYQNSVGLDHDNDGSYSTIFLKTSKFQFQQFSNPIMEAKLEEDLTVTQYHNM